MDVAEYLLQHSVQLLYVLQLPLPLLDATDHLIHPLIVSDFPFCEHYFPLESHPVFYFVTLPCFCV